MTLKPDIPIQISANDPGVIHSIMRLDVLPFGVAIYNTDWEAG